MMTKTILQETQLCSHLVTVCWALVNHWLNWKDTETKYPIAKLAKIEGVLKEKIFQILPDKETPGLSTYDDLEILQQLKEKFLETTEKKRGHNFNASAQKLE
jgi:prenyltransferase beta subunit